jgi:transcriptional regulator with XRE-family HTH domain
MHTNGPLIRRLRTDAGLTRPALALKAGVDRTYLWRVERGDVEPTVRWLAPIAKALGVTVASLSIPTVTADAGKTAA